MKSGKEKISFLLLNNKNNFQLQQQNVNHIFVLELKKNMKN